MNFSLFLKKIGTNRRGLKGKVISYINSDDRLISIFPYDFYRDDDGEIRTVCCEDAEGEGYDIDCDSVSWVQKVRVMDKKTARKFQQAIEEKRPKNKVKHVGVEIEFVSKLGADELTELLVQHDLQDYVTLKDDGSLDTHGKFRNTHELCVLASERKIERVIKEVCKLLKGNSSVNKTCGLHVHLDMRNRNVDKAYANLWAAQPFLYAMCPKTRIKNSYCKPVANFEEGKRGGPYGDDRYVGINRTAYYRHKTIEVRIHSSTLDAVKIVSWVKLLTKIADCKKVSEVTPELWNDMPTVTKNIRLVSDLKKYVDERLNKFKSEHNDSPMRFAA